MSETRFKGSRDALTLLELDRARWEAVVNTARDAIVSIDVTGIVTLFNRTAEEMFGYAAEEVLGRNVSMLMPSPYSDEHDQYMENYRTTRVPKAIGRIRYVEAKHKSGEVFPIELSVSEAQVADQIIYTAIVRDVTESKRTEEELRRERDFARRLIDTAEAIVLVCDRDARIVLYNAYLERVAGWPLAETRGRDWHATFVPEPERPRARSVFEQALSEGAAPGYVNTLLTRRGSVREIEWQTSVLRDAQGAASAVLSIGQDITERRRAERHLSAQFAAVRVLAETQSLVDAAPRLLQAICEAAGWDLGELWYVDPETDVLRLDGVWHVPSLDAEEFVAASRESGFRHGEGLPGRVWASRRPILIFDVARAEGLTRISLLEKLGIRSAFGFPIVCGSSVIGAIDFFDRGVRSADEGLLHVLETLGRQIGGFIERKRSENTIRYSEARFEAFMNNSPAIAYMKDESGRMVYVNRPFEHTFGLASTDVYGKSDFDLWPREVAESLRAHDVTVLAENRPTEVLESVPTPHAGMREWMVFKFPITDAADQRFLGGMAIDVTDRRRAEAQVRELAKTALERERLADIGAITAKIAHDLGNPLSGLSMQAQLVLQRARRDPTQPLGSVAKPIEQLVSEVRRLEGLIHEFLSFAREQRLDLHSIDLPAFLDDVVELWRPVASAHQVKLELRGANAVKRLQADESKLRRVLDNLVKNAIEAVAEGPGKVTITVSAPSSDKVRISVEDTGPGIPATVQVFRLFETTKEHGSGLGLAVSKQIVLAHGGDLVFNAREPRGTAFHVELPRERLAS